MKRKEAGFTLVEMAISLTLLLVALLLAAQVLEETSKLFAETSGEALDAPVPLVIARIRAGVLGSLGVVPIPDEDGDLTAISIQGFDHQILYRKLGDALFRTVVPTGGPPGKSVLLWRGVKAWSCQIEGSRLVDLEVTYSRRTSPRSPLATLPAFRGPVRKDLTQRMYLLPRGAGLGDTW